VIMPPAGGPLFVGAGYRLSGTRVPFIPAVRAVDMEGGLGPGVPLSALIPGRYTVYVALVEPGMDPLDPASWRHTPASAAFDFLP